MPRPLSEGAAEQFLFADDEPIAGRVRAELESARERRRLEYHSRRRRRNRRLRRAGVGVLLTAVLGVAAPAVAGRLMHPSLDVAGPSSGSVLGPAGLQRLSFRERASGADLRGQRWTLDGRTVRPRLAGGVAVLRPRRLADGDHVVVVSKGGGFFGGGVSRRFAFSVDTTAPRVHLRGPAVAFSGGPLNVSGSVEPDARLTVDRRPVPVHGARFRIHAAVAPSRPLRLVATDAVGNSRAYRMPVTIVGRRPRAPVRAVHVTAYGWSDPALRNGVMALIRSHRIDAVEIDLKDESGVIGWPAPVPLGRRIGAVQDIYDLGAVVRKLHAMGVRVIGRLVCFRDPILAAAAWKANEREQVIQTPSGDPYSGYGGFTNFASPAVDRYNIDVAVAAAKLGVDDVLYDYVRRPDGPLDSMSFPGLHGSAEHAIVRFLAETRRALAPYHTFLGASVFGVAATRPQEVAQDIPAMAREVDYIAPMVYPSHWGPGEYDVADPNAEPYPIVRRSLADFERDVKGSGARIVPWLQDFSLGVTYGPEQVRAQIRAAHDDGIDEFILWDPAVSYTAAALDTDAATDAVGTAPVRAPASAPGLVELRPARPPAGAKAGAGGTASGGSPPGPGTAPASGLAPNELGEVPVLMQHEIRRDGGGPYDQTPAEFRAELERLWKDGFVPITASELTSGRVDIPRGRSPVVMTFDDTTRYQFALRADGTPAPDTTIGILLAFARTHPGFRPRGTFYVLGHPFGGVEQGPAMLRWLVQHGFELGNHTFDHRPLDELSATGVQRELVEGARVIERAVPGYHIRSMALPEGAMPSRARLAVRGRWKGSSYGPYSVMLVGANPAPSPYSSAFDPAAVPRIRSSHLPYDGARDFTFNYWIRELERNPGSRYVSDGDPAHITFPASEQHLLAARFRDRARPYHGAAPSG